MAPAQRITSFRAAARKGGEALFFATSMPTALGTASGEKRTRVVYDQPSRREIRIGGREHKRRKNVLTVVSMAIVRFGRFATWSGRKAVAVELLP